MVIVGGSFELDPSQRDQFIAGRERMMQTSRAEAGCLEYSFCADPIDPRRVVLYERWSDQAALDAHLAAMKDDAPPTPGIEPLTTSVVIFDVSGERQLRG
jgi:quinol monooxygenase YgiN